jgi:hypothetical protein
LRRKKSARSTKFHGLFYMFLSEVTVLLVLAFEGANGITATAVDPTPAAAAAATAPAPLNKPPNRISQPTAATTTVCSTIACRIVCSNCAESAC